MALFTLYYNAVHSLYKSMNLQKQGWGGLHAPPAQSSSTSDSRACTSTAVSRGDPGSCGVECTEKWPPTVSSESNHGSSKVRGSSSSTIDPHSHNRPCPCGLTSCSVSPCLSAM